MTDWYSKAMLTLIAALLTVLVAERFVRTPDVRIRGAVYVQGLGGDPVRVETIGAPAKVQLCDERNCARLGPSVNGAGPLSTTDWGLTVFPAR